MFVDQEWDRSAFGVAMRRIEVLLYHGYEDKARQVFDALLRRESPRVVSMSDPLVTVFPMAISELLERHGYRTLESVAMATDNQLREIRDMGEKRLEKIRETLAAVRAGHRLPLPDDLSDLVPDWDLGEALEVELPRLLPVAHPPGCGMCTDPETGLVFQYSEEESMTVDFEQALEVLLGSDADESLEQVDARIAELTEQVERLKRLRKLLCGSPSSGGSRRGNPAPSALLDDDGLLQRIREALLAEGGPLRAKQLAEAVECSYMSIGKICKAHPDFVCLGPGLYDLAEHSKSDTAA